jgi:1,4-dihydroxy-2-naphthoyl-CoA synthase
MCEVLATNAPLAVRGMKRGLGLLDAPSAAGAAAYEVLRRESFNSEDAREGRDALLARRPPSFRGR